MAASRITNSMLNNNVLRDLMNNKLRMDYFNRQVATTRRLNYVHENPVDAVSAMQLRAKLYRIDTYQRNLDDAEGILTAQETALMNINKQVKRAYELLIHATTDGKTDSDRQNIAAEIKTLRDGILNDLNATYKGKYVFGGYQTTTQPFVVDSNGVLHYNGIEISHNTANLAAPGNATTTAQLAEEDKQMREYEVGFDGLRMQVTIAGSLISGYTASDYETDADGNLVEYPDPNDPTQTIHRSYHNNIYVLMDDLYNQLMLSNDEDPDVPQVNNADGCKGYISKLQDQMSRYLTQIADIGGRSNRVTAMQTRYATEELNYTERRSNLEDADMAEAATQFATAKMVYEASLASAAKLIQPTLMDYLR